MPEESEKVDVHWISRPLLQGRIDIDTLERLLSKKIGQPITIEEILCQTTFQQQSIGFMLKNKQGFYRTIGSWRAYEAD